MGNAAWNCHILLLIKKKKKEARALQIRNALFIMDYIFTFSFFTLSKDRLLL